MQVKNNSSQVEYITQPRSCYRCLRVNGNVCSNSLVGGAMAMTSFCFRRVARSVITSSRRRHKKGVSIFQIGSILQTELT